MCINISNRKNALSKESTHKKNLYWFVMGGSTPHYHNDLRRPAEPGFGLHHTPVRRNIACPYHSGTRPRHYLYGAFGPPRSCRHTTLAGYQRRGSTVRYSGLQPADVKIVIQRLSYPISVVLVVVGPSVGSL
jgi:hypothetical protein